MKPIHRRETSSGEVGSTSAALLALALCLLPMPMAGQARVSTIQEAIERWSPETHVYVIGDVGLKPAELSELESWLAGGHWTILLVQDASGQTFRDVDGATREGADAVEYGTGQGMARTAGFAAQTHPETGEPDGTILSIVLAQHALCYTASTAQDGRGFGDTAFAGNLDRWAVEALRNGGDVMAAVRNTVTNVDGLLASEIERKPREERVASEPAAPLRAAPAQPSRDLSSALARAEEKPAEARELGGLSFVAAVVLLILLFALNLWRRDVKEEAETLLASWQTALDRKLEALFGELEQRVSKLAGPASGEDRRGYKGETEALAAAVRADVGALIILWTSASAILEKARQHIRPRRVSAVLANLFLSGPYRKGIALLRDEPVPFDPAEGLPRLFDGERGWREDLLGDLASHEPFRKSFEELMAEFHARAERAAGALDELEAALTRLPSRLESIRNGMWQASFQKSFLQEAGAADGLFLLPALFAEALPAADAALEEARQTLEDGDPVKAHRESAARADRIAADALALTGLVREARSVVLPAVAEAEAELARTGFATAWMPGERAGLSDRAADLASRAAREDASAAVRELGADLAAFQVRAARAVELAARLPEARAGIEAGEGRVKAARQEMGSALGLAPGALLRETDQDPSESLAGADWQVDAARTALDFGDVAATAAALEQSEQLTAEASALVDLALETFRSRESAVEERCAETGRLAERLPEHEALVARLREAFAPSALTLESGGTVADTFGQARDGIEAARRDLDSASAAIREGRILAAAALFRQIHEQQERAGQGLAAVAARRDRLDSLRAGNRLLLGQLADRFSRSGEELDRAPWITPETRAELRQAEEWMAVARSWIEACREDPVQAEAKLLAAGAGLDRVETELAPADRRRYEEALARAEEQRRQEEQDRRDRERRAERARSASTLSSSSSSSSSSRGSSSGSSSGSYSSSGSGRSSWGSSGSGSGRSGW